MLRATVHPQLKVVEATSNVRDTVEGEFQPVTPRCLKGAANGFPLLEKLNISVFSSEHQTQRRVRDRRIAPNKATENSSKNTKSESKMRDKPKNKSAAKSMNDASAWMLEGRQIESSVHAVHAATAKSMNNKSGSKMKGNSTDNPNKKSMNNATAKSTHNNSGLKRKATAKSTNKHNSPPKNNAFWVLSCQQPSFPADGRDHPNYNTASPDTISHPVSSRLRPARS